MKRGIFLVANLKSQELCANLVYSIRQSGCTLPIKLVHFGGKEINAPYILQEVELLYYNDFQEDAKQFIQNLRSVLTGCPLGFLYRFLAWFLDWDEFIYSDNDVVALCNWENLFPYLNGYDLVHADEEYTTKGVYNFDKPALVQSIFGEIALESAITAGHIVVRRNDKMKADINNAVSWFKQNSHIPKKHDQALLHIASLLGSWKTLNLCKPPYNWLSSWAGDYKNALVIIHSVQGNEPKRSISHLHYSGSTPEGNRAIEDLLFSNLKSDKRMQKLFAVAIKFRSGLAFIQDKQKRILRRLKFLVNK